eukprot:5383429-Prymnesium_polylepis.1
MRRAQPTAGPIGRRPVQYHPGAASSSASAGRIAPVAPAQVRSEKAEQRRRRRGECGVAIQPCDGVAARARSRDRPKRGADDEHLAPQRRHVRAKDPRVLALQPDVLAMTISCARAPVVLEQLQPSAPVFRLFVPWEYAFSGMISGLRVLGAVVRLHHAELPSSRGDPRAPSAHGAHRSAAEVV